MPASSKPIDVDPSEISRIRARFEDKWEPVTESGCWLWTSSIEKVHGYGRFFVNGASRKAHRVSYAIYRGEIPPGLSVLHRCDVRICVNPDHLFLGTHRVNMADMVAKGRARAPRGEASHKARLAKADVLEILLSPLPATRLAEKYGVNADAINKVRNGQTWAHAFRGLRSSIPRPSENPRIVRGHRWQREPRVYHAGGLEFISAEAVAEHFRINRQTVYNRCASPRFESWRIEIKKVAGAD